MAGEADPMGAGIGWIEPIPFSDITGITGEREVLDLSIGAAGAGIGFLYAHRNGLDPNSLEWARQTADRLIEMSVDGEGGPNWLMMADMPFPFDAPNFAHGASGVGYFLADLHRATGEQRYLDVAIAAAGYVEAHTTPSGGGHLVCHTEQQPELFYLGQCHGPPGIPRCGSTRGSRDCRSQHAHRWSTLVGASRTSQPPRRPLHQLNPDLPKWGPSHITGDERWSQFWVNGQQRRLAQASKRAARRTSVASMLTGCFFGYPASSMALGILAVDQSNVSVTLVAGVPSTSVASSS